MHIFPHQSILPTELSFPFDNFLPSLLNLDNLYQKAQNIPTYTSISHIYPLSFTNFSNPLTQNIQLQQMAFVRFSLFLLATITNQCLAQAQAQAQATAAPVPAPALLSRPVNLTAILEKGGQYTTFKQLLDSTQIGAQIENQVRYSTDGITIFAPIDNAFRNLKPGTLNGLTAQQQVQLVLNHVVPKFYSLAQFETVSDPVRTQATGQKGGVFGLNVTSLGNNQLNVSSGVVETTVTNALRQQFPLAVYQVDKVLMPKFGAEDGLDLVEGPSPDEPNGLSSATEAQGPVARSQDDDDPKNGGCGVRSMGIGVVVGIGLVTMGFLS